ncbi:MAG: branched-chain amino acid ABC transporter permease [Pseudomonadota bacterium]
MLSFGHAAYFGVGGYAVALLLKSAVLPLGLALAAAPVAAAGVATVVGFLSVRRTGIYFAMLTFAFQMLLYTIAIKWTGLTGGFDGVTGLHPRGALSDPRIYYLLSLAVVAAALFALRRLVGSPFGYVLRALRTNPRRVQYIGVDIRAHQWATFVIAGAGAGLAGGLFAVATGNVFPSWLDWTASATPIVMAVLGGIHSFLGPVIGAAVYVVLEVVISGQTEYWPLAMGLIILALVLLLPEGLAGWRSFGWRTAPARPAEP